MESHDFMEVETPMMHTVVGGAAAIIYGVLMVQIAQRVVADIRAELFNHLQALSMAYHDHHRVGDLMSHVGVQLPLDHAAARFMTELVPGDDSATRAEFGLTWRSAEETFGALLRWLVAAVVLYTAFVMLRSAFSDR